MNANNKNYSTRPLTEQEREFAATNHNRLSLYMRKRKLNPEEWYDILVIPYLNAVKKYQEYEHLQIYSFSTILERDLDTAVSHHFRSERAKKRRPDGGFVSLDYTMEGDNLFSEHQVEAWLIDPMQNVERYVVEKEFLDDIYSNIYRYAAPELLKLIIDMRQEGYSNREIARKAIVMIEDYQDCRIMEVAQLIRLVSRTYGNSPLKRLYDDTLRYGNIDKYQKWEHARGTL